MKILVPILATILCAACTTVVYVPKIVSHYVPIPNHLLQCDTADTSKIVTWDDLAVYAREEKGDNAVCRKNMDLIKGLKVPSDNTLTTPSKADPSH